METAVSNSDPIFSLPGNGGYGRNRFGAEVAELADALDSGSSARKGVGVQVPPSAPMILRDLAGLTFLFPHFQTCLMLIRVSVDFFVRRSTVSNQAIDMSSRWGW